MRDITGMVVVLVLGFSAGCGDIRPSSGSDAPAIKLVRNRKDMGDMSGALFISHPVYSDFSVCHGHTCRYISRTSLDDDEWKTVTDLFNIPSSSPADERERVRVAVARLETLIGTKVGTSNDKAENFEGIGESGQMDCVDESTNTSVYLTMLQNARVLRWHAVDHRVSRGLLGLQAPHFTAVLREKHNNKRYAVDSWFLDNGEPPYIVPLSLWKKGWKP